MPACATKAVSLRIVVKPLTFFWMTRLAPSIYALYQLLPSVQRSTAPILFALNLLIDPLNNTWALVAVGPSTALKLVVSLLTRPVLPAIEKTAALLASPPQICPSEAVPQKAWFARWNVSCARVTPGIGDVVDEGVTVGVGDSVGEVCDAVCRTNAVTEKGVS